MSTTSAENRRVKRCEGLEMYMSDVIHQIQETLGEETPDVPKLIGQKRLLESLIDQISEVHKEILNQIEPDDVGTKIFAQMKVIQPTYEVLANIDAKVEALTTNKLPSVDVSHSNSGSSTSNCKLPKLELPIYRGNPLNWQGFWDQFEVSIHNND